MNREYPNIVKLFAEISYDNNRIMLDIIEEALEKMDEKVMLNLVCGDDPKMRLAMNVFKTKVPYARRDDRERISEYAADALDVILNCAFDGNY